MVICEFFFISASDLKFELFFDLIMCSSFASDVFLFGSVFGNSFFENIDVLLFSEKCYYYLNSGSVFLLFEFYCFFKYLYILLEFSILIV